MCGCTLHREPCPAVRRWAFILKRFAVAHGGCRVRFSGGGGNGERHHRRRALPQVFKTRKKGGPHREPPFAPNLHSGRGRSRIPYFTPSEPARGDEYCRFGFFDVPECRFIPGRPVAPRLPSRPREAIDGTGPFSIVAALTRRLYSKRVRSIRPGICCRSGYRGSQSSRNRKVRWFFIAAWQFPAGGRRSTIVVDQAGIVAIGVAATLCPIYWFRLPSCAM